MKINKPSHKKIVIILISAAIVATCGYGAYALSTQKWPFVSNEQSSSKTPETSSNSDQSQPANTPQSSGSSDDQPSSPKTPVANEPTEDTTPKDEVGVTITAITPNNNTLRVSSLIEAITNQGACTLAFEKGGKTVTKTSGIQALPHSSTCKGFTIPVSELSSGTWHVKLSVTTEGKSGSASKDYGVQ